MNPPRPPPQASNVCGNEGETGGGRRRRCCPTGGSATAEGEGLLQAASPGRAIAPEKRGSFPDCSRKTRAGRTLPPEATAPTAGRSRSLSAASEHAQRAANLRPLTVRPQSRDSKRLTRGTFGWDGAVGVPGRSESGGQRSVRGGRPEGAAGRPRLSGSPSAAPSRPVQTPPLAAAAAAAAVPLASLPPLQRRRRRRRPGSGAGPALPVSEKLEGEAGRGCGLGRRLGRPGLDSCPPLQNCRGSRPVTPSVSP